MKGCRATGIFPRTRKEGAAMIAEITMSAVKVGDGMVTWKGTLSQMKEVGKAVEAAAEVVPPEEVDVHDTKTITMDVEAVAKDADGSEIRKLQKEDGAAAVVVVIMIIMMITMMIMTIQDGAVVLVAAMVDGLATRRDVLRHQKEAGAEAEAHAETAIMTSMKARTTIPTMNIQTNTKTRMKMKAAMEVAVDADAGPEAQADHLRAGHLADKDLPA